MGRLARSFFGLSVLLSLPGCGPSTPKRPNGNGAQSYSDTLSELKMTAMHMQSFGDNGIEWDLHAPFAEVFSRKNLMRLKTLSVQLFDNGQKSTDVSADQGVMSTGPLPDNDRQADQRLFGITLESGDMHLSGNVVMVSTDGTKITTDWARYHKKTDLITSTAPVKVERDDSTTYGTGLEASADMSRVRIFNETLVIPEKPGDSKL